MNNALTDLPADAAEAAAPQLPVDAGLPDPSQVVGVEKQVVPFLPAWCGMDMSERLSLGREKKAAGADETGEKLTCTTGRWTEAGSCSGHPGILLLTRWERMFSSRVKR